MHVELFGIEIPVTVLENKQYIALADLVHSLGLQGLNLRDRSQMWQMRIVTQKSDRGRLVTNLYLPLSELPIFLICPPVNSVDEKIQHALCQFRNGCTPLLQSSLTAPYA
ncbi:MAG: hypothetical protein R3E31_05655 [Chloroflexota bacterium]|nr:hypothetical protein [Ardenticatenaceae bacterium]